MCDLKRCYWNRENNCESPYASPCKLKESLGGIPMAGDPIPGDMIDFPCSADFASYYASKGLTKDFPPGYYHRPDQEMLHEEVTQLREELSGKKKIVHHRITQTIMDKREPKISKGIEI